MSKVNESLIVAAAKLIEADAINPDVDVKVGPAEPIPINDETPLIQFMGKVQSTE